MIRISGRRPASWLYCVIQRRGPGRFPPPWAFTASQLEKPLRWSQYTGGARIPTSPLSLTILRPGTASPPVRKSAPAKPRPRRRSKFDPVQAADVLRGLLIDRLDDAFHGGEIWKLLTGARDALREHGLDAADVGLDSDSVLCAVQNDLFPEAFLSPKWYDEERAGLVPHGGVPGGGRARTEALIEAIRSTNAATSDPRNAAKKADSGG